MKAKLEKEAKKEKLAKVRRTSELEGYQTDLLDLQRKIQFYNKYSEKLKTLVE